MSDDLAQMIAHALEDNLEAFEPALDLQIFGSTHRIVRQVILFVDVADQIWDTIEDEFEHD